MEQPENFFLRQIYAQTKTNRPPPSNFKNLLTRIDTNNDPKDKKIAKDVREYVRLHNLGKSDPPLTTWMVLPGTHRLGKRASVTIRPNGSLTDKVLPHKLNDSRKKEYVFHGLIKENPHTHLNKNKIIKKGFKMLAKNSRALYKILKPYEFSSTKVRLPLGYEFVPKNLGATYNVVPRTKNECFDVALATGLTKICSSQLRVKYPFKHNKKILVDPRSREIVKKSMMYVQSFECYPNYMVYKGKRSDTYCSIVYDSAVDAETRPEFLSQFVKRAPKSLFYRWVYEYPDCVFTPAISTHSSPYWRWEEPGAETTPTYKMKIRCKNSLCIPVHKYKNTMYRNNDGTQHMEYVLMPGRLYKTGEREYTHVSDCHVFAASNRIDVIVASTYAIGRRLVDERPELEWRYLCPSSTNLAGAPTAAQRTAHS